MVDHRSLLQGMKKGNQVLNIKGRGVSERPSLNIYYNWELVSLLIHFFYYDERIM
jgi:hypothetical protein